MVNFIAPTQRGGNFEGRKCKINVFLQKIIFSTPEHGPYKTKCIVMITKEGSTKSVNFMTPGAGFLVQGRGHMS